MHREWQDDGRFVQFVLDVRPTVFSRDTHWQDLIRLFSTQRGPVAQLDRALRFERRGWEFKSLRVHQFRHAGDFAVVSR